MFLAKRCKKAHNISTGDTLKIGTLHEYRKTEDPQILDREEAMFTFKILIDETVTIERKWFNTFFPAAQIGDDNGLKFPGPIQFYGKHLHVLHTINDKVTMKSGCATIIREGFNSFIFCMSYIENREDCLELFPEYDDQWYIKPEQVFDFARDVGDLLYDKVVEEFHTGNFIIPANTPITLLNLDVAIGEVQYNPRELHVTKNNLSSLEEYARIMADIASTKPPMFSHEKELRIKYTFHADGKYVVPTEKPIFVDATPLRKYLI